MLPQYDGEKATIAKEHMATFQVFTDNMYIVHDDVFMRLFVQNFEGYIKNWFKELPANSINSWLVLETAFMRHWSEKRDHL